MADPASINLEDDRDALSALQRKHMLLYVRALLASLCVMPPNFWFTTLGLFNAAVEAGVASPSGLGTALMSAMLAAVLIGAANIILFQIAANALKQQRWAVAGLAISLFPFILGISTYNAVLGNAGPPALVYDMRDLADDHATYYELRIADAAGAQSAAVALAPLESSVCTMAAKESSEGLLSGSAGQGGVYAAYTSGCEAVRSIIATLNDTHTRTNARRDKAAEVLSRLRDLPNDANVSVFERRARFRDVVGDLSKLLEASGAENVTQRLRAQLGILHASIASLGVKGGAFGQRQTSVINNLKGSLSKAANIVNTMMLSDQGGAPARPAKLRPMIEAVWAYKLRLAPQIMIAIASDFMLLWLLRSISVSKATLDLTRGAMRRRLVRNPPKPSTGA